MPGKVCGREPIEKANRDKRRICKGGTSGFRRLRRVDQMFILRQPREKYVGEGKNLYVRYMNLKKAYES